VWGTLKQSLIISMRYDCIVAPYIGAALTHWAAQAFEAPPVDRKRGSTTLMAVTTRTDATPMRL